MRRKTFLSAGILLFLMAAIPLLPQSANNTNNEGVQLYKKGDFQRAEEAFRKSLTADSAGAEIPFNLGNSQLRQKKYDEAVSAYNEAVNRAKTNTGKANARYNSGNTFLEQQKWDEAIKEYREALKLNPNDEDAKYNLSYALKKRQKDNQNQKNNQNQNNQNNQDQKKDDQKKDDQKQNQDKNDQKKDDQKKNDQNQNQDKKQDQKQEKKDKGISKQDAERILDAMKQSEKDLQKQKDREKKKANPVQGTILKDW